MKRGKTGTRRSKMRIRISSMLLWTSMLSLVFVLTVFSIGYLHMAIGSAEESIRVTLQSLASQVSNSLEGLSNITLLPYVNTDIMRSLNSAASEGASEAASKYELNQTLDKSFKEYLQLTGDEINDFLLITNAGTLYHYSKTTAYCDTAYPYQEQEWYEDAASANGKAAYVGTHYQDYIFFNQGKTVFSVARVIKNLNTREPIATIIADSEVTNLARVLTSTDLDSEVLFVILDGRDRVICSGRDMTEAESAVVSSYAAGQKYGSRYQISECEVEDTDWRIIALTSRYGVFSFGWSTFLFLVIMFLLYLILNQSMFHFLSIRILRPLQELSVTMKAIQGGDLSLRYQIQSEDEVGELGTTFNDMLDQIERLMERQRQSGILLKRAEYSALQSQIEPHFIYNVLSNFAGLNRMGERELLEQSISELAQFLRYMLNHADSVTLAVEISMLEKYCNLLKLRFGDRLESIFSCDPEFQNVLIPKLLLQPIIENSIVHGIEPADCGGYVSIVCEEIEQHLVITVADNGVGFDADEIEMKNGVGIKNVQERLKLFYENSQFKLTSSRGFGTTIEIIIPVGELKIDT